MALAILAKLEVLVFYKAETNWTINLIACRVPCIFSCNASLKALLGVCFFHLSYNDFNKLLLTVVCLDLDYRFDGWLGDDILESVLTFIVTERLKNALLEISPTGVEFAEMTTSKSEQFEEMYPNRQLPTFFWLKVNGQAGVDDFGLFDKARTIIAGTITQGTKLVVSERVLDTMEKFQIDNCEIDMLSASLAA